jgi:hypothetical protein
MGDSEQISVQKVLLATIRPIASMLLRFGVNYLDFDRVCKAAFVDAAMHDFGVRGKPANCADDWPNSEGSEARARPAANANSVGK